MQASKSTEADLGAERADSLAGLSQMMRPIEKCQTSHHKSPGPEFSKGHVSKQVSWIPLELCQYSTWHWALQLEHLDDSPLERHQQTQMEWLFALQTMPLGIWGTTWISSSWEIAEICGCSRVFNSIQWLIVLVMHKLFLEYNKKNKRVFCMSHWFHPLASLNVPFQQVSWCKGRRSDKSNKSYERMIRY